MNPIDFLIRFATSYNKDPTKHKQILYNTESKLFEFSNNNKRTFKDHED